MTTTTDPIVTQGGASRGSAWDAADIADILASGLRAESDRLDHEQAVRGIDALDELGLHGILRAGVLNAGLGALAEQRFPAGSRRKRRSEGERCDLVITREPGRQLIDPLLDDTLFAGDGIHPEAAYWIECKVAAQHALVDGVAMPNPRYAGQLLRGVASDARKLASERGIKTAAACAVVFTETREVAEHDIAACAHRCLDKGLPIRAPAISGFPIRERMGNAWCAVALLPVCP